MEEGVARRLSLLVVVLLASACAARNQEGSALPGAAGSDVRSRAPESVTDVPWRWISSITPVTRITVADPGRYTVLLTAGGRAEVQFDCNKGGGRYEIGVGRLSFGPLISTRMACPADSQDAVFMSQLQQVRSFFIQNGELFLEMPADAGTMRFSRAGARR